MRRLAFLVIALLLAVAVSIPNLAHAKPVHAVATACEVASDVAETVYTDWHASTGQIVPDSYPFGPSPHLVGLDLWSWRISSTPGGTGLQHCYRGYYASVATNDATDANMTPRLSTWVCGQVGVAWTKDEAWAPRADAYTWQQWGIAGRPSIPENVTLPSGANVTMWFADYGPFPIENGCLPSAWTDGFRAASATWTPTVLLSSPTSTWFCHDRDDPQTGKNFYCP